MRTILILLISFGFVSHEILGQQKFNLCPKHPFEVIDGNLHDVLDNDFAVNGRNYPTITSVSASSIAIVNPFIDEKDVFEIFNRKDSTSIITEAPELSIKFLLKKLELPYSENSVVKQLNFFNNYLYFIYANDSETCKLIQFDTTAQTYKICASFNNTLKISRTSGSIYFFQGLNAIAISSMMMGQSVIVNLESNNVYYTKNQRGLYTIGILDNAVLAVDVNSRIVYKLSYLSTHGQEKNMEFVLCYARRDGVKQSFFFDYFTSSLYVYFFDFKKFCVSGESYIIK